MRRTTPLAAVALALCAGAVATPTAGAREASFCHPMTPAYAGLATQSVVAGRGGDVREPDLGELHADLPATAKGRAGARFKATVPVYFHVITDGAAGNLTDAQIAAQVSVLNATFAGSEGGADTGFSFRLVGVTRTDNAAWFNASPGGTNENTMKQTLHQGGADALNLYSTTAGGYLGWAYSPEILTKPGQAHLDGIVIDWESMPGTSRTYAGKYDQGETATHETGHWLDLEHTFYGGCSAKGDYVDDTPPEKTATTGCPAGKDTCSAPDLDPIHNYMDYSYDSCYTQFTAGQAQRMKDAWLFYRAGG
jgi:Pregnancy-associated plasma protein-A